MAKEMKEISIKYKKEVSEIHALFESVCCNKETLIKILHGEDCNQMKWGTLEDLALKAEHDSPAYQNVLKTKGAD